MGGPLWGSAGEGPEVTLWRGGSSLTLRRCVVLGASLGALSPDWADEAEETLELRTNPKAARRPGGRRLEVKPGGRRPDWDDLGSTDLQAVLEASAVETTEAF